MAKAANIDTTNEGWETVVEPYAESWDFQTSPVCVGTYLGSRVVEMTDKRTGEIRNTNVYELDTEEGKRSVWGSFNIDAAFESIPVGNQVRIVFEGQADTSSGQRVNRFTVQTRAS